RRRAASSLTLSLVATNRTVAFAARGPAVSRHSRGRYRPAGSRPRPRTVRALDGSGKLISFYPASVGSKERPAPSGTRTIRSVDENPTYTYSPNLHCKRVKPQKPFTIAPGPNNPGRHPWTDLGASYGTQGTPEPPNIGKAQSHGCVRLTNWDAKALGKMVHKGIKVEFIN